MNKVLWFASLVLAALIGLPAHATPISTTINLGTVFTGSIPDGGPNWLTATFNSQTGSTTGTLVLTANFGGSDFVKGATGKKVTPGWSFFLNSPLASSNPFSCSGTCASAVSTQTIAKAGPVTGPFNLTFIWPANTFAGTDSATYTLNFANALTGNPFTGGGANGSGWTSVAHVQSIGPKGQCSGWIVSSGGSGVQGGTTCANTPPQSVPEPAELGMFGFGVLLIGLFLGLRRRWQ